MIIFLALLIGVACGLRALMGLAILSWAARLHRIHLDGTVFAFMGYAATPFILSAMAIGELVNDKLPKTPSRLVPPQFITRVVTGALCGAILGSTANTLIFGLLAGIVGSVAGTLGGAKLRGFLATTFAKDLPAALLEDALSIVLAVVVVSAVAA